MIDAFQISGVVTILTVILGVIGIPSVNDIKVYFDESFNPEICESSSIQFAVKVRSDLDARLQDSLFGQHLAHKALVREIYNHLANPDPSKPLILSFHGSPGLGKRFTSVLVMRALYKKGEHSKYVRIFSAKRDFTEPDFLIDYKSNLTMLISKTVQQCAQSLFVIDGVDILPLGLLDALVPLVSHFEHLKNGKNYKHSIFIFIGDSGDQFINNLTLTNWKSNNLRSNLKQQQFETVLSNEAFKVSGGWYKSQLDERIMVDKFIPFLPMEKRHVLQCFRRLAKSREKYVFSEDEFEEMASKLEYWPNNTNQFSKMGCETVGIALDVKIAEKEFWLNKH